MTSKESRSSFFGKAVSKSVCFENSGAGNHDRGAKVQEDQLVTFAKRAMDFHQGWTREVEDQLIQIFRLTPDQVEKLKEQSRNFDRKLSEPEQRVEFAKKAMEIHEGWNTQVETDLKRIFRLTDQELDQVKSRSCESLEDEKQTYHVKWLDFQPRNKSTVQFNETYFSELRQNDVTNGHSETTNTDTNDNTDDISDEFSEPSTQEKGILEVQFNPGDFGFAFDMNSGIITEISKDGQASKINLQEGWKIEKINGETYGKNLIKEVNCKQYNTMTFKTKMHYPKYPLFA